MATQIHLKNAPIVEALVDFRIKPVAGLDIQKLSTVADLLKERYPEKRKFAKSALKFNLEMSRAPRNRARKRRLDTDWSPQIRSLFSRLS